MPLFDDPDKGVLASEYRRAETPRPALLLSLQEIEVVHQGYRCFPVTEEEPQAKDGKERFFAWGPLPAGRGCPSCASEALKGGRNTSCMLRDKVVLLHKGFNGCDTALGTFLSVEESVVVPSARTGRSPVTELKNMGSVDIQRPAGKTGLGRMVKPHPQKAESSAATAESARVIPSGT